MTFFKLTSFIEGLEIAKPKGEGDNNVSIIMNTIKWAFSVLSILSMRKLESNSLICIVMAVPVTYSSTII